MQKKFKAIILAGGSGTRLHPITKGTSKQLLPVFDKPMVYFPLSIPMLAGIRDILVITTPEDSGSFKRLLGDGSQFGINLSYAVQEHPNGLAEAFIIGRDFIGDSGVMLVLGDNLFYSAGLTQQLVSSIAWADIHETPSATVFGYKVDDPERYGVAEFDKDGKCVSLEEKPEHPKSNYAVPGLYIYPNDVVEKVKEVKPSARGELEITTLNQMYLAEGRLKVEKMQRGSVWLDTGTFSSLMEASNFVETIENRQGIQIACLEEIAYNNKWITKESLISTGKSMEKNAYGKYLLKIANDGAAN